MTFPSKAWREGTKHFGPIGKLSVWMMKWLLHSEALEHFGCSRLNKTLQLRFATSAITYIWQCWGSIAIEASITFFLYEASMVPMGSDRKYSSKACKERTKQTGLMQYLDIETIGSDEIDSIWRSRQDGDLTKAQMPQPWKMSIYFQMGRRIRINEQSPSLRRIYVFGFDVFIFLRIS